MFGTLKVRKSKARNCGAHDVYSCLCSVRDRKILARVVSKKRQNTPIAFNCVSLPDMNTDNGERLSKAAQCALPPDIHTTTSTAVTQQQ